MENQNLKIDLLQFTGTENYYRYHKLLLTDGAYYLAETAQCFWMMDVIWSHVFTNRLLAKEEFITFTLSVCDSVGKIIFDDGNDNILATQHIPYTDFPLNNIKLYLVREASQFVVMLPGEY